MLNIFLASCTWTRIYFGWRPNLRDEADNHLVELAVAGGAGYIVTRNVRDLVSMELKFPRHSNAAGLSEGDRSMSALTLRLLDEKHNRLKTLARQRGTSVNRLMEEMVTLMLAEFDAETRFAVRAARGRGRKKRGLALLDKAAGRRARSGSN